MDTAQTEKLKALALAATPGPWFESDWGEDDGSNKTTVEAREPEVLRQGQSSMWPGGVRCIGIAETEMGARPIEDAAFIAAANPATVLELIAEVERLRAEAERYRWLRDKSEPGICAFYLSVGKAFHGVKFARETVDEAIDAAMAEEKVAT